MSESLFSSLVFFRLTRAGWPATRFFRAKQTDGKRFTASCFATPVFSGCCASATASHFFTRQFAKEGRFKKKPKKVTSLIAALLKKSFQTRIQPVAGGKTCCTVYSLSSSRPVCFLPCLPR
ncbi:hypothetical protein LJC26_08785, partial [Desulfovibrio sp. OttesenSCG-928-O18]|nr:hypothetical protein [Desulfovibrio sp. OttesenSCG-928-O18]